MTTRANEPPVAEPIGYLLTWPTYGSWLPGDARGWQKRADGPQPPSQALRLIAKARMVEPACLLGARQRTLVEQTIARHCALRKWALHAVNCRSNHVHVVVSADLHPDRIRDQLKAWCSRELNRLAASESGLHTSDARRKWWAERGSVRYLNDDDGLASAVHYVAVAQDFGGTGAEW